MNREEIQQAVSKINRYSYSLKQLPDLVMNWEYDLDKMDFSALRSGCVFKNPKGVMIVETPKRDMNNIFDEIFLDLVEFVKTGKKLIPPFCNRNHHYINGELSMTDNGYFDGMHRINLANLLGLKEIPVVYNETYTHTFCIVDWCIEIKGDSVIVTQKKVGKPFCFNAEKVEYITYEGAKRFSVMVND